MQNSRTVTIIHKLMCIFCRISFPFPNKTQVSTLQKLTNIYDEQRFSIKCVCFTEGIWEGKVILLSSMFVCGFLALRLPAALGAIWTNKLIPSKMNCPKTGLIRHQLDFNSSKDTR